MITKANWNGEVPQSYEENYIKDALLGNVDKLYGVYGNGSAITESFRAFLEDGGEWPE